MADSFLPYQDPAVVSRKLDSESLAVGLNTVERERVQITGVGATDIAPVTAADGVSVKVTNTVPVSAVALPLPAGAATAANQSTEIAGLASIDASLASIDGKLTPPLAVDGSGFTQPISAAALPLPAGAATAALQLPDGHNVTVDNGAGAAAVPIQDGGNVITVDGTVTAAAQPGVDIGDVTINNAIGAAAFVRITDSIGGLTAQVVGTGQLEIVGQVLETNSAGIAASLVQLTDWDETNRAKVNPIVGQAGVEGGAGASTALTQRVAIATDANTVVVSAIAHDSPDSGNPVKIGGKAKDTQGAAVTAADRVDQGYDRHGAAFTRSGHQAPAGVVLTNVHSPAANTQATTTRAAGIAGTRHVCTGLTATLAAGASAPAAVQLNVALRDGGSGAGTILWQAVISLPALAGAMNGITRSGIWIPGSTATAMTLEFSAAGGANTVESVSMEITDIVEA